MGDMKMVRLIQYSVDLRVSTLSEITGPYLIIQEWRVSSPWLYFYLYVRFISVVGVVVEGVLLHC